MISVELTDGASLGTPVRGSVWVLLALRGRHTIAIETTPSRSVTTRSFIIEKNKKNDNNKKNN